MLRKCTKQTFKQNFATKQWQALPTIQILFREKNATIDKKHQGMSMLNEKSFTDTINEKSKDLRQKKKIIFKIKHL